MSTLTINNAEFETPGILDYSMTCIGNWEVETCIVEEILPIDNYVNYTGDMLLTFDLVSVNYLDIQLSKNGG